MEGEGEQAARVFIEEREGVKQTGAKNQCDFRSTCVKNLVCIPF